MAEVNLLKRYPRATRDLAARHAAQASTRTVAMQFGQEYFDGDRTQGYGGYRDDGRWRPVAETFRDYWGLKAGDRVLDVGCAKGFLVQDLLAVCPGLEAFGLDLSAYALAHAAAQVRPRLVRGDAAWLPFEDGSFDAVISINTVHNLTRPLCAQALRELMRVSRRHRYVQVDAYRSPEEKAMFLQWVLTAKTHGEPDAWRALFQEAGYDGDYYWTITE